MEERDSRTSPIIAAAIEVHRHLGPGLLESIYERAMQQELILRGLPFQCQVAVPITYKGVDLQADYRIDLLVNDAVVVELKAVEKILPVHEAQLLTYLRVTQKPVGLLINFNVPMLANGIVRRVL